MCQEVFKVLQSMDLSQVETKMALQCAPVITGVKISNLLIVASDDEDKVRVILRKTGIILYRLFKENNKIIYLVFRRIQLYTYLQNTKIKNVLNNIGYKDFSLGGILRTFQKRYETYMNDRKIFPHEMGILLGYPIEDVLGFMEQKGKNYLYSGYWKVYRDVSAKKKIFAQYENAKEELILWLEYGYEIHSIIRLYCR
ncbi:MAG: DUF3793 family protein [Agathobacter sp.]|nr:DUF3793 family protein [Agathobacter sp.]